MLFSKDGNLFFKKKRRGPMREPNSRLVDMLLENSGESNGQQKIESKIETKSHWILWQYEKRRHEKNKKIETRKAE